MKRRRTNWAALQGCAVSGFLLLWLIGAGLVGYTFVAAGRQPTPTPVSYTHLTLPTIYSV